MNLVAKEFVAARDDEHGVLVLSALAGAAQELEDAVIINPYDVDAFAAALARAIDMTQRGAGDADAGDAEESSRDGTSSTGRPTSWRVSRACGPSRCSIRSGGGKRRRSETEVLRLCDDTRTRPILVIDDAHHLRPVSSII